jgi:hypothetical protein
VPKAVVTETVKYGAVDFRYRLWFTETIYQVVLEEVIHIQRETPDGNSHLFARPPVRKVRLYQGVVDRNDSEFAVVVFVVQCPVVVHDTQLRLQIILSMGLGGKVRQMHA